MTIGHKSNHRPVCTPRRGASHHQLSVSPPFPSFPCHQLRPSRMVQMLDMGLAGTGGVQWRTLRIPARVITTQMGLYRRPSLSADGPYRRPPLELDLGDSLRPLLRLKVFLSTKAHHTGKQAGREGPYFCIVYLYGIVIILARHSNAVLRT